LQSQRSYTKHTFGLITGPPGPLNNFIVETKIKYDVLTYEGKRKKITQKYDVPDFEEIRGKSFLAEVYAEKLGINKEYVITVEEQIDEHIAGIDKAAFMDENEIHIIFNWVVVSAKKIVKGAPNVELVIKPAQPTEDDLVKLFLEVWQVPEKLKIDFAAVYMKMKPTLKGLKLERKIDVVISSMSVAYTSVTATFDRLNEDMAKFRETLKIDKC